MSEDVRLGCNGNPRQGIVLDSIVTDSFSPIPWGHYDSELIQFFEQIEYAMANLYSQGRTKKNNNRWTGGPRWRHQRGVARLDMLIAQSLGIVPNIDIPFKAYGHDHPEDDGVHSTLVDDYKKVEANGATQNILIEQKKYIEEVRLLNIAHIDNLVIDVLKNGSFSDDIWELVMFDIFEKTNGLLHLTRFEEVDDFRTSMDYVFSQREDERLSDSLVRIINKLGDRTYNQLDRKIILESDLTDFANYPKDVLGPHRFKGKPVMEAGLSYQLAKTMFNVSLMNNFLNIHKEAITKRYQESVSSLSEEHLRSINLVHPKYSGLDSEQVETIRAYQNLMIAMRMKEHAADAGIYAAQEIISRMSNSNFKKVYLPKEKRDRIEKKAEEYFQTKYSQEITIAPPGKGDIFDGMTVTYFNLANSSQKDKGLRDLQSNPETLFAYVRGLQILICKYRDNNKLEMLQGLAGKEPGTDPQISYRTH